MVPGALPKIGSTSINNHIPASRFGARTVPPRGPGCLSPRASPTVGQEAARSWSTGLRLQLSRVSVTLRKSSIGAVRNGSASSGISVCVCNLDCNYVQCRTLHTHMQTNSTTVVPAQRAHTHTHRHTNPCFSARFLRIKPGLCIY